MEILIEKLKKLSGSPSISCDGDIITIVYPDEPGKDIVNDTPNGAKLFEKRDKIETEILRACGLYAKPCNDCTKTWRVKITDAARCSLLYIHRD